MIAAVLAAALLAALPEGEAVYRMELGGAHVGEARLAIRCEGPRCTATWATRLRLPEEAGGGLAGARVSLPVGRDGLSSGGTVQVLRDGVARKVPGVAGAVPAMVAPLVLAGRTGDGCVPGFEEETGVRGEVCGRRLGAELEVTVLGEVERVWTGADGFPDRLELPVQRARFVRVAGDAVPAQAPRAFGVRVGGDEGARTFCGVARDAAPPPPRHGPGSLPPPAGRGASCREVALDYLARAGREGRVVLGVAWTGEALAWHAWVEVRDGAGWLPVDPTFGQLPASAPRFTVARYAPGDEAARLAAGRRVLACWGERAR